MLHQSLVTAQGGSWTGSSPAEKNPRVLVDGRLDRTQHGHCEPRSHPCPELHPEHRRQQGRWGFCPCSGETHLGHHMQLWGPQHRPVRVSPEETTKRVRGAEHFSYKERLRELGLLTREEMWRWGDRFQPSST